MFHLAGYSYVVSRRWWLQYDTAWVLRITSDHVVFEWMNVLKWVLFSSKSRIVSDPLSGYAYCVADVPSLQILYDIYVPS